MNTKNIIKYVCEYATIYIIYDKSLIKPIITGWLQYTKYDHEFSVSYSVETDKIIDVSYLSPELLIERHILSQFNVGNIISCNSCNIYPKLYNINPPELTFVNVHIKLSDIEYLNTKYFNKLYRQGYDPDEYITYTVDFRNAIEVYYKS